MLGLSLHRRADRTCSNGTCGRGVGRDRHRKRLPCDLRLPELLLLCPVMGESERTDSCRLQVPRPPVHPFGVVSVPLAQTLPPTHSKRSPSPFRLPESCHPALPSPCDAPCSSFLSRAAQRALSNRCRESGLFNALALAARGRLIRSCASSTVPSRRRARVWRPSRRTIRAPRRRRGPALALVVCQRLATAPRPPRR